MDGIFRDYLEKRSISDARFIIQALKLVKLTELAENAERDIKSGLWNNENSMHVF